MKKSKFCLALLLALVLMTGMISLKPAMAQTGTMHVEVEEMSSGVAVRLIADSDIDFGGIWFSAAYDKTVFTYAAISSPIGTVTEGADIYEVNNGNKIDVAAGEAVVTLTYAASGIVPDHEYKFDLTIKEAYDDDSADHVAPGTVLSGTYIMAGSTPPDTTPAETTPPDTTPAETTPPDTTPAETTPPDTTPAETTPPDTTPAGTTPSTGDNTGMTVFITTGCTAALMLGVLLVLRRRETGRQ